MERLMNNPHAFNIQPIGLSTTMKKGTTSRASEEFGTAVFNSNVNFLSTIQKVIINSMILHLLD